MFESSFNAPQRYPASNPGFAPTRPTAAPGMPTGFPGMQPPRDYNDVAASVGHPITFTQYSETPSGATPYDPNYARNYRPPMPTPPMQFPQPPRMQPPAPAPYYPPAPMPAPASYCPPAPAPYCPPQQQDQQPINVFIMNFIMNNMCQPEQPQYPPQQPQPYPPDDYGNGGYGDNGGGAISGLGNFLPILLLLLTQMEGSGGGGYDNGHHGDDDHSHRGYGDGEYSGRTRHTRRGSGGTGDPHLTQMSSDTQSWYDFQGKNGGGVYNWFSNKNIQMNVKLNSNTEAGSATKDNVSTIGQVGIALKDKTGDGQSKIQIDGDGKTTITKSDGTTQEVADGASVTLDTADGSTIIKRVGNKITMDNDANSFDIVGNGGYIDITSAQSLQKDIYSNGVLGVTDNGHDTAAGNYDADGDGDVDWLNGEGVIDGKTSDYEIAGGDLFGTSTVSGDSTTVLYGANVDAKPDYDGDKKADALFLTLKNGKRVLNAVRDGDKGLVGVHHDGDKLYLNDGVGDDNQTQLRGITIDANGLAKVDTTVQKKGYLDFSRDLLGTVWAGVFSGGYATNHTASGTDANKNHLDDAFEKPDGTPTDDFLAYAKSKLTKDFAFSPWGLDGKRTEKTAGEGSATG